VVVNLPGGPALITGDAAQTADALRWEIPSGSSMDKPAALESLRRL